MEACERLLTCDAKGRVTLGKQFADRFLKETRLEDGSILLTPQILIDENEAWFFKDHRRVEGMKEALKESEENKTTVLTDDDLVNL